MTDAGHTPFLVLRCVLWFWCLPRIRTCRWSPHLGWHLVSQRLVRTHLVELIAKCVQLFPLASQIGSWGTRRLGLHRAMHALVAAILLRFPRLDPIVSNPQLDPPHTQCRETAYGIPYREDVVLVPPANSSQPMLRRPYNPRSANS